VRLRVDGLRDMPVTATVSGVTVRAQAAVYAPSCVVTVMVALPSDTAVTSPAFTVAMAVLLLSQVRALFVASGGATVAVRVAVAPGASPSTERSSDTPLTATTAEVTVTVHTAVRAPSFVITEIVAVPVDTAVTSPSPFTVATSVLLLSHVTVLSVASAGDTVAVRPAVSPGTRLSEERLSDTPLTGISSSFSQATKVNIAITGNNIKVILHHLEKLFIVFIFFMN
jgi:hypothetical protein